MFKPKPSLRLAALLVPLACSLGFAGSASAASPTGAYAVFNHCPLSNPSVTKCVYSEVTSGEVKIGKTKVPIKNKITLQGGTIPAGGNNTTLVAAEGAETLSKTAQPVPGGLLGLVECDEISNIIERVACEVTFENGLTGVNAVTELAGAPSTVVLNTVNLYEEEEVALKLPVKIHLENPLLGSSCYIGSASEPVTLELTTGTTSPPAPNKPIKGSRGKYELLEGGSLVKATGASLVENAFAVPAANGCGGVFSFLIDPIIDAKLGLPSAAGNNTAILNGNLEQAAAEAVRKSE